MFRRSDCKWASLDGVRGDEEVSAPALGSKALLLFLIILSERRPVHHSGRVLWVCAHWCMSVFVCSWSAPIYPISPHKAFQNTALPVWVCGSWHVISIDPATDHKPQSSPCSLPSMSLAHCHILFTNKRIKQYNTMDMCLQLDHGLVVVRSSISIELCQLDHSRCFDSGCGHTDCKSCRTNLLLTLITVDKTPTDMNSSNAPRFMESLIHWTLFWFSAGFPMSRVITWVRPLWFDLHPWTPVRKLY